MYTLVDQSHGRRAPVVTHGNGEPLQLLPDRAILSKKFLFFWEKNAQRLRWDPRYALVDT
jgi:hypothetical protein